MSLPAVRECFAWLVVVLAVGRFTVAQDAGPPAAEPSPPRPTAGVRALLEEADRLRDAGRHVQARAAVARGLAAARSAEDPTGEAWAQQRRAQLLVALGRRGEAAAAWEEAAASWARAGDGPSQIQMLVLAGELLPPEQAPKAIRLVERAVELGRAERKRPQAAAAALGIAARRLYIAGFPGAAAACWEAFLIQQERLEPGSRAVADRLNEVGVQAYRQEYLDLAGELFRRSLALHRKLRSDDLVIAGIVDHLGMVATAQSDLDAAAEYHRQALAIYERRSPDSLDLAYCLNNLGNVARERGDLHVAQRYYARALIMKEKHAPDTLTVASTLNNMGVVAEVLDDLSTAESYHRRALVLRERLAPGSLAVAASLNNLGAVAEGAGRLAEAEGSFRRAEQIQAELATDSLHRALSLRNLARVRMKQRDLAGAEPLARQAWALVRGQAASVTGDEALQAFGAATAAYATELVEVQLALGKTAAAFMTAEEGRSQALLQILRESGLDTSEAPDELRTAYREARATRDQADLELSHASSAETLARRALAARREERVPVESLNRLQAAHESATRRLEEARSASTRARLRVDALWTELKRHSPRTFVRPLTLEEAVRGLPPDTLLLSYSVSRHRSHLFLLQRGTEGNPPLVSHPISLPLTELTARIEAFLEAATEPLMGVAATAAAGRRLFAALVPAEARSRVLGARRLLISPEGPLWEVPFAALVTNEAGPPRYLGADRAITLTKSLGLFIQAGRSPRDPSTGAPLSALVVGNPRFTRGASRPAVGRAGGLTTRTARGLFWRGGRPPAPLPATAVEARQVARLYGGPPLLGEQASEGALRQRLGQAGIVHVATHGYSHPTRAMASGLLLSPPEQEPPTGASATDGVLQAWEIYSQLTLKAELVVLSACDTGRGENVRGEGIVGLTRALQYAGARSVVTSQWAVADQSTAKLMVAFHRKLRQGLAKDEALRQAMAGIRSDARTAHPYYWAPFFLTGDPEPLSRRRLKRG